ncbi:MAG: hypothetical protein ACKO23_17275 [Gemmataceae bacterium]
MQHAYHGGYGYGPMPGIYQSNELDLLREENDQLRSLCGELEQALQESTQQLAELQTVLERQHELEAMVEEKTDTIRNLHMELQQIRESTELSDSSHSHLTRDPSVPAPKEDELLALSEAIERDRRQLQDDEQVMMEQMRQNEMQMARERAEMARQRNDLQRLYGEIRHELERLERNTGNPGRVEDLKAKFQDVSTRRGAAPSTPGTRAPATMTALPDVTAHPEESGKSGTGRGSSFMGRFFGK